jgi:prolyl-tRNA synthetase
MRQSQLFTKTFKFIPKHPKEIWEKTDRWKYAEMFKLKDRR